MILMTPFRREMGLKSLTLVGLHFRDQRDKRTVDGFQIQVTIEEVKA